MFPGRETTTLPTNDFGHRTTERIDSTNLKTDITVSKLRCNCGHETIFYNDVHEAMEDMRLHHDLVNHGKVPDNLKCSVCSGLGKVETGDCIICDGTGIRKDIPSSVDQNGYSIHG